MVKLFKQPYSLSTVNERIIHTIAISAFVYLFLVVFEPFDLNLLDSSNKDLIVLGYGVFLFLILGIFYVIVPLSLPTIFSSTKWNVYKELLWMIFVLCLTGMGLSLYEHFIGTRPIGWNSLYETVLKTAVIGFFPIAALVVLNYMRLLKKHYDEAEKINAILISHEDNKRSTKSALVSIESDNKSESFSKEKDSILFLSTLGNYVEIYFEKDGDVKKEILRTTLSKAEKQLSEYTDFYRCHRAFIVNTSKIVSLDGNASGYYLHFQNTNQIVPVSRRNTSTFKNFMSGR